MSAGTIFDGIARFASTPMRDRSVLARYGVAVGLVAVASGGGWLLQRIIQPSVFPFYYLAVIIAAWYGGMGPGLLATVLAGFLGAYVFMPPVFSIRISPADLHRLVVFTLLAIVTGSLAANRSRAEQRLREAQAELEARVRERTAKLQTRTAELHATNEELLHQSAERRKMQQAILDISEREQQRIGHDLHDGLGQELTGIAFLCKALAEDLFAEKRPEAAAANEVVGRVNRTISQARELARGLCPTNLETEDLSAALRQLSLQAEALFNIECRIDDDARVQVSEQAVQGHLYRIAQEAISNAVKHGRAKRLHLVLRESQGRCTMTVSDDGAGFTPPSPGHRGMGLQLMSYRARMIGGSLEVTRTGERGTSVICTWPAASAAPGQEVSREYAA